MERNEDKEKLGLTGRLIDVIETRSNDIAKVWYQDVKESSHVPSFKRIPEAEALEMATKVYKKLGYWLLPTSEHEVAETYEVYGGTMFRSGFAMEEVVMTLVLIKRYLWLHLLEEGLMSTGLDVYKALELNNKVVLYFDRAIYFALRGYNEARAKARAAVAS